MRLSGRLCYSLHICVETIAPTNQNKETRLRIHVSYMHNGRTHIITDAPDPSEPPLAG